MSRMASSSTNPLFNLLSNAATRDFLRCPKPPLLFTQVHTLPLSKKLLLVPVSTKTPVTLGVAVMDSPSGYALTVINEDLKAVLLVGECHDGTEVVVMTEQGSMMARFEGSSFNKFLSGNEITPVGPGDCAKKLPRSTGDWNSVKADAGTEQRIRKWANNPGKLACPVALLNGKIRMCRGLAVWELLSGNTVEETQEQTPQRRLLKLAPAPTGGSNVVKEVASEAEERRRKAELRKARNRESAQRSNMRRKLKLQALKEELEEVCKREKRLRKREKDLKEENSELKMTVTK